MDDYENPFGMSEEEFLYRAMNEEDPMYMGPTTYTPGDSYEYQDGEWDQETGEDTFTNGW